MSLNPISLNRAFGLAKSSILASKWRSALSLSTILLGAVAVVATFTINENVDNYIDMLVKKSGGPILRAMIRGPRNLEFSTLDFKLISSIPGVDRISPLNQSNSVVFRHDLQVFTPTVTGLNSNSTDIDYLRIIYGRKFSDIDFIAGTQEAIVSPEFLRSLKIDDGLGMFIRGRLDRKDFVLRIIGIGKMDGRSDRDDGSVWITSSFYKTLFGRKGNTSVSITLQDFGTMDLVERSLKSLFENKYGKDLRIVNPRRDLERQKTEMKALVYAGMTLGILALMSGSVGIMNVMLVGVRLRRREIGLYRALGFSSALIRMQFFIESSLLSLSGGVAGALLGSGVGVGLSAFIVKPYQQFSLTGVLLGIGTTFVIGSVFGIIPALQASKLDPVEALRS